MDFITVTGGLNGIGSLKITWKEPNLDNPIYQADLSPYVYLDYLIHIRRKICTQSLIRLSELIDCDRLFHHDGIERYCETCSRRSCDNYIILGRYICFNCVNLLDNAIKKPGYVVLDNYLMVPTTGLPIVFEYHIEHFTKVSSYRRKYVKEIITTNVIKLMLLNELSLIPDLIHLINEYFTLLTSQC